MTSSASQDCPQLLNQHREFQRVLNRIVNKIRSSIDLKAICVTTNHDVARLLDVERIAVYQFSPDWSGQFINEYGFAKAPWNSIETFGKHQVWDDSHLKETQGGRYKTHDPFAVSDIYEAGHSRCHIEVLEQFQIRAYVITPIFIGNQLWGLLAAYQHSGPRLWQSHEVTFLTEVADHLGVAMQYSQQQQKTAQGGVELNASLDRQQLLAKVVSKIRSSLDYQFILQTACQELCQLLQVDQTAVYQFEEDWSGKFVYNYSPDPQHSSRFSQNPVWEDTHLKETQGGRYRNSETLTTDDIYQAGHTRCHLDLLEQYKIRAYAVAPIFVGHRLWGLLGAYQHLGPHAWQPYETEFLTQVAAQMGVAIQQAELLNHSKQQAIAMEKSVSRQRMLTEVVSKVRSSLDIDLILQTTCEEVAKLLGVGRVAVYRFNSDWSGKFVSQCGPLDSDWHDSTPFGENPIWEDTHLKEMQGGRYRNNETLAVDDIYQAGYARCHLDLLEQYKVRAYALVPIFVGRKLWGLLAAYQHAAPYPWTQVEVDFLSQVANQLGVAIQSAMVLNESQTRAEDLEQAAAQRKILFDVVAKIRESLDLETIFETTAQEVRRSLKVDRVGIFQFQKDSSYRQGCFIAEDVLPDLKATVGTVVEDLRFGENYAIQHADGDVQVIADIRSANFKDAHIAYLEQFNIKAQIVMPLMKGTQLWGLLCIHQCDRTRDWTASTIDFLKQVAAQLSVGLLQANLLAQTQHQAEQLTQTVKELQSAQLRIIQSEKMASLGQFVAGVAHEINNPISFIYGNLIHADDYVKDLLELITSYQSVYPQPASNIVKLLKKIDTTFIKNDLPKLFESMQVGTERIQEIVDSLRNFSRLDESEVKEVNIHKGMDSTLMIVQNRLKPSPGQPSIRIVKEYDPLPQVECYAGQLNQVFMNLIVNAIDALEERNKTESIDVLSTHPSQIHISTKMIQPDWISVNITDNGPGIEPEIIEHVFDPFYTTKPVGKGTGLGLSISHQIITEKHHGKLYCYSSKEQGTEFVIEIPIKQLAATPEATAAIA